MDCLIAAIAVVLKGILLTQDKELGKIIKKMPETKDLTIWSWNDFLEHIR